MAEQAVNEINPKPDSAVKIAGSPDAGARISAFDTGGIARNGGATD